MFRVHAARLVKQALDESVERSDVMNYQQYALPIEYTPSKRYSRRELIELIRPHAAALCFFALQGGEQRCVLGVDFEKYDRQQGMAPVHIVPGWAVKQVLIPAEGRKFRQAYRRSGVGKSIVVTYTESRNAGWFKIDWELEEKNILTG